MEVYCFDAPHWREIIKPRSPDFLGSHFVMQIESQDYAGMVPQTKSCPAVRKSGIHGNYTRVASHRKSVFSPSSGRNNTNSTSSMTCGSCGKIFENQSELTKHVNQYHINCFICTVCGKRYATKVGLREHTIIHEGKFRYSCQICGKGFQIRSHFQDHLNTHTGTRPFECSKCKKTFTYKKTMKSHELTCQRDDSTFDGSPGYSDNQTFTLMDYGS